MYRCVAIIDGNALLHNLAVIQKITAPVKLIMMVKANAYGHGLKEVAHLLKDQDIAFGVAAIDEALILREAQITQDIFLFDGGASSDQSEFLVNQKITPVLTDLRSIDALEAVLNKNLQAHKKPVHLKIDSGFTRLGLNYQEVLDGLHDQLLDRLKNSQTLELSGVATHFARTDDYIEEQMTHFSSVLDYLKNFGLNFEHVHIANSAGILTGRFRLDEKSYYVRPGLSAYGLDPLSETSELLPVMSIKAQIVAIKILKPGQGVGYGHSFKADQQTKAAIITMGYGDGLRRSLSNKGFMLLKGQKAPIIGTISMDSCAIDISHIDGVKLGDMVTVLGRDGDQNISAWDLAKLSETIPYEVLTSISARLTRLIK